MVLVNSTISCRTSSSLADRRQMSCLLKVTMSCDIYTVKDVSWLVAQLRRVSNKRHPCILNEFDTLRATDTQHRPETSMQTIPIHRRGQTQSSSRFCRMVKMRILQFTVIVFSSARTIPLPDSTASRYVARPGLLNTVEIDLCEHRVKNDLEKFMQRRCEGSEVIIRKDSSRKPARSWGAQLHNLRQSLLS